MNETAFCAICREGTPAPILAAAQHATSSRYPANCDTVSVVTTEARAERVQKGNDNEARFGTLLKRTRDILDKYTAQGGQVEAVTNGGGLDLVRTVASHHITDIRQLIEHYDNVHFIACTKGLERLRALGENTRLIKGVQADEPAADHLIRRLTEGWTLIRL